MPPRRMHWERPLLSEPCLCCGKGTFKQRDLTFRHAPPVRHVVFMEGIDDRRIQCLGQLDQSYRLTTGGKCVIESEGARVLSTLQF